MLKVKIKNLIVKSLTVVLTAASIFALQGTSEVFADVRDPSVWIDGGELKDYGVFEGKTAQALTFGQKQWYIAGQDQDNFILMCSPATAFEDRAFSDDGTQNVYTESSIRRYLTVSKDELFFPEEEYALSSFTEKEQALMKNITASDLPVEGDKLTLPSGTMEEEAFKVGSGQFETAFSLKEGPYGTGDAFWMRQAGSSEEYALAAVPAYYVTNAAIADSHAVLPVMSLDLSSVYFASAAPAGTAGTTFQPDAAVQGRYALTLRYNDTEGRISSVAYRSPDGAYVEKGWESGDVYLYVQNNEGTGWVWSAKIDQSVYFAAGDIFPGLASLEGCKIWLETVDENLAYAKDAQIYVPPYSASGSISFSGSVSLTGRALTEYDQFTFTLSEIVNDSEVLLATVQNDASGYIAFPAVTYLLDNDHNDTGYHVYRIRQVPLESAEIIPDLTEYTVTVDVNDGPHDGNLVVTPSAEYYGINFVNYAKPAITITANSEEKFYDGSALTNSGYTLAGNLMDGDYINYLAISGSQTDAGSSYNTPSDAVILNASGADVTGNYTVNYVSGLLTVYPANVTVTANDASKTYGGEEPPLTAYVEGLVNEEPVELISYTIYREPGEEAGTYAVIPQGEAAQGNYSVSYVPGTFTIIQPVRINLHAEGYSGFYDGAAHYVNAYTELADGTVVTYSTNGTDWSVDVPYIMNAGAFTVYVKAENPNCETETAEVTLELAPASATVTALSTSKTYGSEDPELTAAVSGLIGEDAVSYSLERAAGEDAGTYTITAYGEAFQGNYSVIYENAEFIINPAPAAVTAIDASKYYGAEDPQLTAVVTGLVNGESEDKITYSIARETGEDPGTYAIIPQGEAAQGNYAVSYVPGTFTIVEQQKIELSVTGYSGTYDGTAHYVSASTAITEGTVITYSINGTDWSTDVPYITDVGSFTVYVKAENPSCQTETAEAALEVTPATARVLAVSASKTYGSEDPELTADVSGLIGEDAVYYSLERAAGEDAGAYTITVSGETAQGNYAVIYENAEFVIAPAPATVTANNASKYLNAEDPALTATVTGLVNGDTADKIVYSISRETGEEVGTYAIIPQGEAAQGNYTVSYVPGTFTIVEQQKIDLSLTGYSGTYDGTAHYVSASTVITEGTVITYSINGTDWSGDAPYITDVGSFTVHVKAENPNCQTETADAVLEITPAAATVTAVNAAKTYGTADPALTATVTGLVNNETADKITYSIARAAGEEAGTYTITVSGEAAQGNYAVIYENAEFIINPAPATVTADNASKFLNAEDPALTATVTGLVNGDTADKIKYSISRETGEEVGTYAIIPQGEASQGNYAVSYVPGTFTIVEQQKIELSVTGYSGTYDGTAHYVSASTVITEGTVITYSINGTDWSGDTPYITDVGSFTVYVKAENPNCQTETADAVLEITPASAAVTADNSAKTYGAADPALTAKVTGLVNDETADKIKYSISRAAGEDVGTYTTTVSGEAAQGNYTVTFVNAEFMITPAQATVTANNASKFLHAEDPALTAAVTGLVNGDTADKIKYSISREAGEEVGTYAITPQGEAAQGNYTVSYVPGTFTITEEQKIGLSVTGYSGTYDGNSYYASVTTAITDGTVITYSTNGTDFSADVPYITDAGKITVYVKAENPKCKTETAEAVLEVIPAAATVTAVNTAKTYGTSDPALTATVTGLVNNETADKIAYSISRAAGEDVGTYVITPAGEAVQGNYSVTYKTAEFMITPAPATVTAVNAAKTYGTSDPALTATVTGLVNNETAEKIAYSISRAAGEDVGTYVITPAGEAVQGNYSVTYKTADFMITPAPAKVTAKDVSKVYGAKDPELTAEVTGLVNNDTTVKITYTISREAGEGVGTYAINPQGETTQGNYTVSYVAGKFTITSQTTFDLSVTGYSGTYDGTAHYVSASASITDGTVISYSTNGIDWSDKTPYIKDVGNITIYVKAENPNFETKTAQTVLQINQAAVTVTANDLSKVFGAADPILTVSVTGLVNNETADKIEYNISRTAGENPGTYPIVVFGDTSQGNYKVSYVSGTFTINEKIAYSTVNAEKIEWTKGNLSGMTVTVKGSADDNATFSKFRGAQVDKITVQAKDMVISSGSLVLTLKASYLSLISAGEHTLDILFSDGSISVPFTIKDAATPTPTLTPAPKPTSGGSPSVTPAPTTSPKVSPSAAPGTDNNGGEGPTGDNHNRMIWIMLIVAAAAVIAALLIWRKRENS